MTNEPHQKTARDWKSVSPTSRVKLSLEAKNEILEIFGIPPIGEQVEPERFEGEPG